MNLILGDCLSAMRDMEPDSIDAIVTDPPYGLKFMGKEWDANLNHGYWAAAAERIAKPGCHLLAFGGTRTFHRLVCALEDAGWEIRDCLGWLYGSGFPKSLDVSKAIDKAAGAKRKRERRFCGTIKGGALHAGKPNGNMRSWNEIQINEPATDAAREWSGWGTALKPAWEPIVLARKPLDGTVAENVQKWGTGAINVDGCRIPTDVNLGRHNNPDKTKLPWGGTYGAGDNKYANIPIEQQGRWPANLIHDGSEEVVGLFPQTGSVSGRKCQYSVSDFAGDGGWGGSGIGQRTYDGFGSAARFFYCAKVSRAEREAGLEGMEARECMTKQQNSELCYDNRAEIGNTGKRLPEPKARNHHPTVKPLALMRYLCRLITPPSGTILDPFMGSGTTGMAAKQEGFDFIGIEKDKDYFEIAEKRIAQINYQPLLEMQSCK